MNPRLKKFQDHLLKNNIDAFLVTKPIDISYLVDFPSEDSWLLVTRKEIFYITDARYTCEVQKHLKKIEVQQYTRSLTKHVAELALKKKIRRIGFDDRYLSVAQFCSLKKNIKKSRLITVNFLVEALRAIKTKKELFLIRKAIKINLKCYQYLGRIIKPGLTERKILDKLESYVKAQKVRFSFPPIIASGPHASYPHAKVTSRKLRRGEVLLVDLGIEVQGYKSDLTRMFFLGKIPESVKEAYRLVCQAQQCAILAIKPGQRADKIDKQARNFLKQNKLDKFFSHSLGHGIGLEVHENPTLSSKNRTILKEGMVLTVEPGVYLPDQFGIRVEDMVLVTAKGCKVLSR
ncbi:MAG: Xaa-Pro peptidase family protein [Candidatus Aceula meridiana]|nr:Xaa-Pro peptidase family protein [Candidatus Aceula meridiana]